MQGMNDIREQLIKGSFEAQTGTYKLFRRGVDLETGLPEDLELLKVGKLHG